MSAVASAVRSVGDIPVPPEVITTSTFSPTAPKSAWTTPLRGRGDAAAIEPFDDDRAAAVLIHAGDRSRGGDHHGDEHLRRVRDTQSHSAGGAGHHGHVFY